MAHNRDSIEVYLEIGQTRTLAVALDWPGWCRGGRDEAAALQALYDYGPRYAQVLQTTALGFHAPTELSALIVIERLTGNATTDFGAPAIIRSRDAEPVDPTELERWSVALHACWQAFDQAVAVAAGKTLSKGPRGGGRDLGKIIQHVREVDAAYLNSLGGKLKPDNETDTAQAQSQLRQTILTTLTAAAHGEIPARGPRGGVRWPPRYFVRRLAWHELDHAWEIEDRAE